MCADFMPFWRQSGNILQLGFKLSDKQKYKKTTPQKINTRYKNKNINI